MNTSMRSRFSSAPWFPKEDTYVLIGGAGGIGSWTAMLLARAGFLPMVYDFDLLEEHNIGGQLYSKKDTTKPKVQALANFIRDYCDIEPMFFNEKIVKESPSHKYCIAAFDNMEARLVMFENWVAQFGNDPTALFIDGRLTAEQMWIFCIRGCDQPAINDYRENHLFHDSEIEDAPCTMKQTSHAAAMIAAHITGFFTNHITNIVENDNTRSVPFKWEYFIPMDLLDVTNTIEHGKELHSKAATESY